MEDNIMASNNLSKTERNFMNNLAYWIEKKGINQSALADFLKVSNQTITNYIKGYNSPRMNKVDQICLFLGIERNDLLDNPEEIKTRDKKLVYQDKDFYLHSDTRQVVDGADTFLRKSLLSMTEEKPPTREEMITWLNTNRKRAAYDGRGYSDMDDETLYNTYIEELTEDE